MSNTYKKLLGGKKSFLGSTYGAFLDSMEKQRIPLFGNIPLTVVLKSFTCLLMVLHILARLVYTALNGSMLWDCWKMLVLVFVVNSLLGILMVFVARVRELFYTDILLSVLCNIAMLILPWGCQANEIAVSAPKDPPIHKAPPVAEVKLPEQPTALFSVGQADLSETHQQALATFCQQLDKTHKLSVEGHTDNTGSLPLNEALSAARAQTVARALIAHGIDSARISVIGHAYHKPIADNNTEEGRQKNRRTEVIILP